MKKVLSLVAVSAVLFAGCSSGVEAEPENEVIVEDQTTMEEEVEVGNMMTISMAEVEAMSDADGCLSVIDGKAYDFTDWIAEHPGGADNVLQICGKDGSAAFNGQHSGQQAPEMKLEEFYIGELQ